MRRIFPIAVLFCFLPLQAFSQPIQPTITKMGNGLTVIVQEDHATDLVGLDVWVKAGSANETPDNNGISHFIEHLVFGATSKRESGDLDREIESLGATLDAHTSRDWAHFNTTVNPRYIGKAMEILADAVTGAQFKDADVQRERLVILDEIAKKNATPSKVCDDLVAKEIFSDHPYSLPVEGTAESVKKITRQDILDYYRKYYTPGNMAVVLVGDIDASQAVAEVGKAFQGMANTPAPPAQQSEPKPLTSQVVKPIQRPFNLSYLSIGFLGPSGASYTDVCAMDVLLTYIGSGYRSWMTTELKDKMGLAQEAEAKFLTQKQQGMVILLASTKSESIDKTKGAIFAGLAKIRTDGVPAGNLEAAKRSLLGEYAFLNETFSGRANTIGFYFAAINPEFCSKYTEYIRSVTNEDIIRVAQKYLDPAHAVVLTVGPAQEGGSN